MTESPDAAGTAPGAPAPRLIDPLLLAFGTLTALRVPAPRSLAAPVPGRAMLLAPVAGLFPGGLAALTVWVGWRLGWDPLVVAALAVAVLQLSTRGLHLDGLADYADGLAASYDREKALDVMRRGDTGPAGLATTVLVLLVQVAALAQLLTPRESGLGYLKATVGPSYWTTSGPETLAVPGTSAQDGVLYGGGDSAYSSSMTLDIHLPGVAASLLLVLIVAVAARTAVPLACLRSVPAARPEGLGATVAGSVRRRWLALELVLLAVLLSAAGAWLYLDWWRGALAVAVAALAAALVVRRAVRRFGGITGDVIGAAVEFATAATLLALALNP